MFFEIVEGTFLQRPQKNSSSSSNTSTTSSKESIKRIKTLETTNNSTNQKTIFKQSTAAVRRNSITTTVTSSTATSVSVSRTNSPPPTALLQSSDDTKLRKRRPLGVADMEIKSHCEKLKRIIGTSRLSCQSNAAGVNIVVSSSDESVVYECFSSIVAIAQNAAPLEKNTLDDFLMTCHSIRTKQPKLADKVTLLMTQAKTLIEDLVAISNTPATCITQPSSIPSSQNNSDSMDLSQHRTMNAPSVVLQDLLQQYNLARGAGATTADNKKRTITIIEPTSTTPSINVNHNKSSLVQNMTSVPPPIQVTTVKSAPPPIQVTTVKSAPPPIQVTTVKSAPPPIQVTTVRKNLVHDPSDDVTLKIVKVSKARHLEDVQTPQ